MSPAHAALPQEAVEAGALGEHVEIDRAQRLASTREARRLGEQPAGDARTSSASSRRGRNAPICVQEGAQRLEQHVDAFHERSSVDRAARARQRACPAGSASDAVQRHAHPVGPVVRARSAARTAPSRARTARAGRGSRPAPRTARRRARLVDRRARKAARAPRSQSRASGARRSISAALLRHAAQRRPARVVERAQHAGHVAQRRVLGAALLELRAGSPSKSMMTKSLLVQQHLAQVVVAVEARLQRLPGASARAAMRLEQRSARARAAPAASSRAAAGSWPSALAQQRAASRAASARACSRSAATSSPVERLGVERGVAGRAREREVQLGGAPAERLPSAPGKPPCTSGRRRVGCRACAGPRGSARGSRACRPSRRPGCDT